MLVDGELVARNAARALIGKGAVSSLVSLSAVGGRKWFGALGAFQ